MSNQKDRLAKGLADLTQDKTNDNSTIAKGAKAVTDSKNKVGRPVTGKSKSAGVKAGTHFKTSIILPVDLYQELSVEAAKDMQKDMSDIIADMLKARYKRK